MNRGESDLKNMHVNALRSYFRRRAAPQDVDDLVQEVFANLVARRRKEEIQNIGAYLFVIARNVLARGGKDPREIMVANDDPAFELMQDDAPDAQTMLLDRERLRIVVEAIEKMPPRTRRIFVMHRFEGLTYSAIAAALGISESAVEKRIMRALKMLLDTTRTSL